MASGPRTREARVSGDLDTLEETVARALAEDAAGEDQTSLAVVPPERQARGRILARADGVLAGTAWAEAAFRHCDPGVELDWRRRDGDRVGPGDVVLECSGRARGLLAAERTALNFLQQLSGVATLTARLVAEAGPVAVLDTRKTVPGLRDAQKAAVRAGGGRSHRRDLAAALLLKENHFALSGLSFAETVARALAAVGDLEVGVEVRSVTEACTALELGAAYVLLDNFAPEELPAAVARIRERFPDAVLEASGGFGPGRLAALREAGVDRVSVGALTHSAPALDLSFLVEAGDPPPPGSAP